MIFDNWKFVFKITFETNTNETQNTHMKRKRNNQWELKYFISVRCQIRKKFVLAFNRTRSSNIGPLMNRIWETSVKVANENSLYWWQRTEEGYYILQILVLLIHGHGAYLNFFYHHKKIKWYAFRFA